MLAFCPRWFFGSSLSASFVCCCGVLRYCIPSVSLSFDAAHNGRGCVLPLLLLLLQPRRVCSRRRCRCCSVCCCVWCFEWEIILIVVTHRSCLGIAFYLERFRHFRRFFINAVEVFGLDFCASFKARYDQPVVSVGPRLFILHVMADHQRTLHSQQNPRACLSSHLYRGVTVTSHPRRPLLPLSLAEDGCNSRVACVISCFVHVGVNLRHR